MEDSSPQPDPVDPVDPAADISGKDYFGPPEEPCLCFCLHCERQFMSDGIWFQTITKHGKVVSGFWMCPTANCSGAGFTFDIFPVDPDHPANAGWTSSEDDGQEEDSEWDEEWDEEDEEFVPETGEGESAGADPKPYDPAEPKYAEMEAQEDEIVEGDEWKHQLQPGESLPENAARSETRRRWEEEQKRYDMPDERPRSLDRTNEPDPPPSDMDIPF